MRSGVRVSWVARLDTPPALHGRRATRTGAAQRDAGHRCRIVARTCLSRQEVRTVATRWRASSARRRHGSGGRSNSAARKASSAAASSVRSVVSTLRQRPDRPERERGAPREAFSRSTRHVPATNPSRVKVLTGSWVAGRTASAASALSTRVRSACDSSRLSKSYRKRGGAGTSGPGRGASGRSNSSRPDSSRKARSPDAGARTRRPVGSARTTPGRP